MPILLLERLPLPNLKTYTALSIALLACAIYYANQVLLAGGEQRADVDDVTVEGESEGEGEGGAESEGVSIGATGHIHLMDILQYNMNFSLKNGSFTDRACLMAYMLTKEPWCLVTIINMAYCCLLLVGRLIQKIVFGQLRVGEQQHIKDKFWNFVFYKFIFIFGVMNVQEMYEIVLWSTWFSVLGFLHILAQLCKDRFEYLSFSPATPAMTHVKVLFLLIGIHASCLALLVGCVSVGLYYTGVNTFAFIAAECLLLIIRTLYVLVRYGIHLWDMNHDSVWENRTVYVYYTELIFELSALSVDFAHHLHMLLWGNIFLSMASLVICMQLRYLFYEFQRRIKRYKNYRRVVSTMEAKFPPASPEQLLQNNDDCAICWEKMDSARKLPCGHMFHKTCLRSWLEQDTSCPTCRVSLNDLQPRPPPAHDPAAHATGTHGAAPQDTLRRRPQNRTTDRFHFDGSRYVSWLPSFSVEVTHMQLLGYRQQQQQQLTSQLDSMARSVSEVFPNVPLPVILEDLRITKSVELTSENILEGRIQVPPIYDVDEEDDLYRRPFVGDIGERRRHISSEVSGHTGAGPGNPGAVLGPPGPGYPPPPSYAQHPPLDDIIQHAKESVVGGAGRLGDAIVSNNSNTGSSTCTADAACAASNTAASAAGVDSSASKFLAKKSSDRYSSFSPHRSAAASNQPSSSSSSSSSLHPRP